VIAQAFFEDVVRSSARYAERGGDETRGLVWRPGSREAFLGDVRELEMGSDHEVFEEASFGVPMVYFHDWPDVTIHTNKDQPENLDATKLGRVAYLGAGIAWTLAALPDEEAGRLFALASADAAARIASATARAPLAENAYDAFLLSRESLAVGRETLQSVADLWPSVASRIKVESSALEAWFPHRPGRALRTGPGDPRVPLRNPEVRGPLDVYYYDHLREVLGRDAEIATPLDGRADGPVLAYETLNLVDGKRSVADIRDVLSGRYAPVPIGMIASYLDVLAKGRVVRWAGEARP
jgi:hypothetical protein